MTTKTDISKAKDPDEPCPHCGYCPACGRSNQQAQPYYVPMPYQPWVQPLPYRIFAGGVANVAGTIHYNLPA